MANLSLALQGGVASGTEQSFDGQPVQAGTHLRWSFVSALGFPPGGFQLFRRIDHGEIRVVPPQIPQPPVSVAVVPGATGAPLSGAPGWGAANPNTGWQAWGSLFTLPVTNAHWPARYFNAPLPTALNVVAADIAEADRRLGTLLLAATDTPAQQQSNLQDLRDELNRLVNGFPTIPLGTVPLPASPSGASAPAFNINVMDQLLLLALDPYFARVLGLYFVDTDTAPGVAYDYCIVGYWGNNHGVADVIFPGLASGTQLAHGNATWQGLHIAAAAGTSIWRWIKSASHPLDPTAPLASVAPINNALAGLSVASQPAAIMILANVVPGSTAGAAIRVLQGALALSIQISGIGTITAYTQAIGQSALVAMAPVSFNSNPFITVSIAATGFFSPIVAFVITATQNPNNKGVFALVGAVTVYPTSGSIGNIYALLTTPAAITAPPAPGQPVTTFRKRAAIIDTNALKLVPQSLFDVEWPAPTIDPSTQTGDPITQPRLLPPPTQPIGFTVQRMDNTAQPIVVRIPGWVASRSVPTGVGSKITTPRLYRKNDSQLPDPAEGSSGYSHAVTAFNIFGVIGPASAFSQPIGVEKVAAAPTALSILQFDNSAAAGGAPLADGSAWVGGTLNLQVAWDAATFMMYPDIETAQAQLISIDSTGASTGSLGNFIFDVPAATVTQVSTTITPNPPVVGSDGYSYMLSITTTPALPILGDRDPAFVLMLQAAAPDPTNLSFSIRPVNNGAGIGVAIISVSNVSRLVTSPASFQNQPAYLVSGWRTETSLLIPVPLAVPVGAKTARGQVSVVGSTQTPFLEGEQLVDPNGVIPSRGEPQSAPLTFTGAQRLVPAAPETPLPDVNHIYYDPADVTGQAGKDLPFTTPGGAGVFGYVLKRAPVHSLAIADMARRLSVGTAFDANPTLATNGENLAAFIAALPQWLDAFNAINGTHATAANVLETGLGQRSFIDHFYGGLLDGELRALGEIAANSTAFARVNASPITPPESLDPIRDTVDGTGYGRNLYKMAAVNEAGSASDDTGSVGPVYTRIVTPPRPTVLYKVQSATAAIVVAWALDTNPDVAAYMIYRAGSVAELADLRYFGADPRHPAALSDLPSITTNTQSYPPLTFNQGSGLNIDARLVGFVPDPRLVARDYTDSVMAEIALPPGPPPDAVNAVYRLSDFIATPGATQVGFNYWTAPVGEIPAVVQTTATQTRLIGLRVGLGRSVPVVVVATWNGVQQAIGVVPVRRAGFVDVVPSATTPADPNAIGSAPPPSATAQNFYAVVSVDIFGNRSASSKVFAGQMFGTP